MPWLKTLGPWRARRRQGGVTWRRWRHACCACRASMLAIALPRWGPAGRRPGPHVSAAHSAQRHTASNSGIPLDVRGDPRLSAMRTGGPGMSVDVSAGGAHPEGVDPVSRVDVCDLAAVGAPSGLVAAGSGQRLSSGLVHDLLSVQARCRPRPTGRSPRRRLRVRSAARVRGRAGTGGTSGSGVRLPSPNGSRRSVSSRRCGTFPRGRPQRSRTPRWSSSTPISGLSPVSTALPLADALQRLTRLGVYGSGGQAPGGGSRAWLISDAHREELP